VELQQMAQTYGNTSVLFRRCPMAAEAAKIEAAALITRRAKPTARKCQTKNQQSSK